MRTLIISLTIGLWVTGDVRAQESCKTLSLEYEKSLMDIETARISARSRNYLESSAGNSAMTAALQKQQLIGGEMKSRSCPQTRNLLSDGYAIDAQKCGLVQMFGDKPPSMNDDPRNVDQICDRSTWKYRK